MKKLKWVAAGVGGLIVLLVVGAVVVYANLADIVRRVLEKEVPGLTFDRLEVGWNRVEITKVDLKRGGKSVFKVDALKVYPSVTSAFSDTLRISSIEIDAPYVYVVRNADGSLALPTPERSAEKSATKQPKGPPEDESSDSTSMAVHIEVIKLRDGKGDLLDKSVTGAPARHKLTDLDVTVKDVSWPSRAEKIPFELSARLDAKREGRMTASGWYEPISKSADVELELAELFIPLSEPYFRGRHTNARLGDGVLELETDIEMKDGAYVAEVKLTLGDLLFENEGLFLGVPTPAFKKLLEKRKGPFVLETELKGDLSSKSALQKQLLAAVLTQVAKEAGEGALAGAAEKLKEGVVPVKAEDAKGALKSLFGK